MRNLRIAFGMVGLGCIAACGGATPRSAGGEAEIATRSGEGLSPTPPVAPAAIAGDHAQALVGSALFQADRALAAGEPEVAIAYLEQAQSMSPFDGRVHYAMGVVLRGLDRNDEARAAWERAAQFAPWLFASYQGLADLALEVGDIEAARAWASSAEALAPAAPRTRWVVARVLLETGDAEDAVDILVPLAESPDAPAPLWADLAAGWLALGELDEAAAALDEAVALDAEAPRVQSRLDALERASAEEEVGD